MLRPDGLHAPATEPGRDARQRHDSKRGHDSKGATTRKGP